MKQIFDWLREQLRRRETDEDIKIKNMLNDVSAEAFNMHAGKQMGFLETLALVNEAEAKWKAVMAKLENELKMADEEKERCSRENPLLFDSAKGYAT